MSNAIHRPRHSSAGDLRRDATNSTEDINQSEAIATFAHEVRNILAPLANSCELLHLSQLDEAAQLRAKDIIRRQVRQLSRLVNDLLDARRLERWHVKVELQTINVTKVIENVCNDYRYLFKAQEIELQVELPPRTVYSNVDGDRLGQVMSNLLSNCLKFTDRGGSVWVGLLLDPGEHELTISVADTGTGIPPEDLERIFESDVHQASRRNREGLGLGLPLVRRLVELFGGRVSAHSAGVGSGTVINIVLPTAAP